MPALVDCDLCLHIMVLTNISCLFAVLFGGGTDSSGPLEPSSGGSIIPHTTHAFLQHTQKLISNLIGGIMHLN